jgi:hypothetical protein
MITQRIRRGETIVDVTPFLSLVASKSEVGNWHTVTPESCDCKGFQYRSQCRHISIAFPAVEACETCGALENIVTDSRFVAGVGQVEETRCQDGRGCNAVESETVAPSPLPRTTFIRPALDPRIASLWPARA